jgi:outer membrane beta-barrel protein
MRRPPTSLRGSVAPLVALALCGGAFMLPAAPARAEEDSDVKEEQRVVIQNRKYKLGAELTLEGATLPLDPFYTGLAGTARLTFHFNDFHAWEVIGGTFAYNVDSGLTEQLLTLFGVQRQQLPGLQVMLESDYILKPFYGKFALANRTLLYQEVYLAFGATVTQWTDESLRFGPNIGGGLRFFGSEWFSLRFDIRYALVAQALPEFDGIVPILDEGTYTIDGVLYLGVGMSFNVGG